MTSKSIRLASRLKTVLLCLGVIGILSASYQASAQTPLFLPAPGSPFSTGSLQPYSVGLLDFNRDGNLDALAANLVGERITLFLGDGSGQLTIAPLWPQGLISRPISLATGDFDRDGNPDFAIGGESEVFAAFGNGIGGIRSTYRQIRRTIQVVAGDINNDGFTDIISLNDTPLPNILVLLSDGTGSFVGIPIDLSGAMNLVHHLALVDLNNDGFTDLTMAGFGRGGGQVVAGALGDGTGNFVPTGPQTSLPLTEPYFPVVADYDRNGINDVVVTDAWFSTSHFALALGQGNGLFTSSASSPIAKSGGPTAWAVGGDFDLDGNPDVAFSNPTPNTITVMLGDGQIGFSEAVGSPFATDLEPRHLAVGDMNNDSKPDLVIPNFSGNTVSVLLNQATLPPTPTPTLTSTSTLIATPVVTATPIPNATIEAPPSNLIADVPLRLPETGYRTPNPTEAGQENIRLAIVMLVFCFTVVAIVLQKRR